MIVKIYLKGGSKLPHCYQFLCFQIFFLNELIYLMHTQYHLKTPAYCHILISESLSPWLTPWHIACPPCTPAPTPCPSGSPTPPPNLPQTSLEFRNYFQIIFLLDKPGAASDWFNNKQNKKHNVLLKFLNILEIFWTRSRKQNLTPK